MISDTPRPSAAPPDPDSDQCPDQGPDRESDRESSSAPREELRQALHVARLARGRTPSLGGRSERPVCPRCGSRKVHRWGSFSGRQRHRCVDCRRTFSDFTGSPFWHSRKVGSWLPYLDCMAEGCPLRISATHCGVSLATAFRRRHHILRWRTRHGPAAPLLRGAVGLEEIRIPESFKGSRNMPRTSRSHAVPWGRRTVEGRRSLVLLLHSVRSDRTAWSLVRGQAEWCGVFDHRPDPTLLCDTLRAVIRPGSVVQAPVRRGWTGWPGQPRTARERDRRTSARDRQSRAEELGPQAHAAARGARNLRKRLRNWLPRFRGIATRHLPAYLLWFSAWSHAFPNGGRRDSHPSVGGPDHTHEGQGGGLRLLAVLLMPAEADP